jgi:3-isopropylmalate/(R)-2-methylmalate dehydratase large subunit
MLDFLRAVDVGKRPSAIRFQGRILFLVDDAGLMRRQLAGEDVQEWRGLPLRNDISTDEITPARVCYYFDERLGEFPYLGFRAGGEFPVEAGSVKKAGFVASVSGRRRGKGSSREASPYAEKLAGIRLILAESIERIYKQNCQNLGLLTSDDLELIERVRAGEEIPLEEFLRGEDEVTQRIIEYGGLFNYNVARLQGKAVAPAIETPPDRPMTLAEKIFARHFVTDLERNAVGVAAVKPGDAGFARADLRFSHEYVTPMAASFLKQSLGDEGKINDPSSVLFFRDHLTFLDEVIMSDGAGAELLSAANRLKEEQERVSREQGVKLHGELPDRKGSEGICHSIVYQNYALPGQLIIGTDSHTPHSGAVGCLAFGVGTTDIFNSWITKDVRVKVPPAVLVKVTGKKPEGITAKDFMLEILRHPFVKEGHALGTLVEYAGEAVEALGIDERATMTNMAAEVGAFTGIIAPDGKTARFLSENRGMSYDDALRLCEGWKSDPGAEWLNVIEIDASTMTPMVATPGDPGNGVPLTELEKTHGGPIEVEIAYGGSCTAGKAEDMDMYARVLADALKAGLKVHPRVKFWIQFGSQDVRRYCERRGYLEIFRSVGARVIEPSCGACINAGPGVSDNRDQVTVSAINRNFPGRSGPGQMYLASPLTVAASAIVGYIAAYEPGRFAANRSAR